MQRGWLRWPPLEKMILLSWRRAQEFVNTTKQSCSLILWFGFKVFMLIQKNIVVPQVSVCIYQQNCRSFVHVLNMIVSPEIYCYTFLSFFIIVFSHCKCESCAPYYTKLTIVDTCILGWFSCHTCSSQQLLLSVFIDRSVTMPTGVVMF